MIWWPDDSILLFAAIAALEAMCSGNNEHNERAKEQLTDRCCFPTIVAAVGMRVADYSKVTPGRPDSLSQSACNLIAKLCSTPRTPVDYSNWTPPTSESNLEEQNPRVKALISAGAIEAIVRKVASIDWGLIPPGGDAPSGVRAGCFALERLGCYDHPSDGGIEENHQRALAAGAHPNWLTC